MPKEKSDWILMPFLWKAASLWLSKTWEDLQGWGCFSGRQHKNVEKLSLHSRWIFSDHQVLFNSCYFQAQFLFTLLVLKNWSPWILRLLRSAALEHALHWGSESAGHQSSLSSSGKGASGIILYSWNFATLYIHTHMCDIFMSEKNVFFLVCSKIST